MTTPTHYRWKHGAPRTVFITGSSSGIGRDMARRLAAEGAKVVVVGRDPRRTNEVADAIGADPQPATTGAQDGPV